MDRAIIFDFDGVIVDSETYWPDIWAKMLGLFSQKPWLPEDVRKFLGRSSHGTYDIMTEEFGVTLSHADYERTVLAEVTTVYETTVALTPGIRECFDRFEALSIPMAIASSSKRHLIDPALLRLGIDRYFQTICTGDDVPGRGKPHPDVYLLAAEKLGIPAEACIGIEDSSAGVAAVKAAGMWCIAYHTTHNDHQDLSAADIRINHFDELTAERVASLFS